MTNGMDSRAGVGDAGRRPIGMRPAGLADRWGWLVAAGAAMLALGLFAATHVAVATVATVYLVGILMILASVAQMVVALRAPGWGRTILLWLASVVYLLAGVLAFTNPLLASAALTLALAAALVVGGAARIWFGIGARPTGGWGWVVAGGIVSVLAGLAVAAGWPGTIWLLGLVLAVDIAAQGGGLIAVGLALRRFRRDGDRVA